ncbi:transaldolase [Fastidiosibacter lacustris]|uniref:transaldolase n=1 Tax=Fastidiosibacter lacustris TaxID=2056695 RepID=UPI000E348789|nr:transaldolase [Fastidiosibacter lacustris]
MNKLEQLKKMTKVVADTGDFAQIEQYQPVDATTNPSLLLNAAKMSEYAYVIDKALAKSKHLSGRLRVEEAMLDLAVGFGVEILKIIPGRISTEVDARLSFDKEATIEYAQKLVAKYAEYGIDKSRVLIKVASTWEGIKAAEVLEQKGINCNLTLMFNIVQAIACAQAKVFLISPFVGRITDWYMKEQATVNFPDVSEDNGVLSVKEIYKHYKLHGYKTIIMGASFRHIAQVEALAGCDALTIAPSLLQQLQQDNGELIRHLSPVELAKESDYKISEGDFRWMMNESPMATEKLAEGIRKFAIDTVKLEKLIENKLGL